MIHYAYIGTCKDVHGHKMKIGVSANPAGRASSSGIRLDRYIACLNRIDGGKVESAMRSYMNEEGATRINQTYDWFRFNTTIYANARRMLVEGTFHQRAGVLFADGEKISQAERVMLLAEIKALEVKLASRDDDIDNLEDKILLLELQLLHEQENNRRIGAGLPPRIHTSQINIIGISKND